MAALRFQVEFVQVLPEQSYVIARKLDQGDFGLVEGCALAGCAIDPRYLEIPRAHNPDGTLRLDLFAFLLRHPRGCLALQAGRPGRAQRLQAVRC